MDDAADVEVQLVVAEGILSRDEAMALGAETRRAGQGLLDRLEADGRISADTRADLRSRLLDTDRGSVAPRPRPGDIGVDDDTEEELDDEPPALDDAPPAPADATDEPPGDGTAIDPKKPPTTLDGRRRRDPALLDTMVDAGSGQALARTERADFPAALRNRYDPIRLLGQGGMGRVVLARDLRLHREVAIKFVRDDDPELAHRIVAEARAQARIDDPRVCQVFDVGEVDGQVHIAMQHVDGLPLTDLVDNLTYEQKAVVMREAALGVHAAHRAGLIHRDIKPTNILVERGSDGELRPFVLDFGIARDWTASTTATGTVLGTPQFMAPEQARGEVKQLDRRADIYSLGATMYALLTDHPPIEGENQLVVLNRITLDEPERPRVHDPDLPLDLEAIVMKCLEKDRAARYDSARALADDLGRFLDGAPVAARPSAGVGYWLRRFARRHWRALAVALTVLVIAAVAGGFVLRERWAAARKAELTRRFTEQVERIEALARYSALAPPHDIRPDRARIRELMDTLAAEVRAGGDAADGAGHYALGRGYLALGDDDRALIELEKAWARGFREPRAAYALALANGHLYQRGLREAERLSKTAAPARRTELEQRYRDPARRYLLASEGASVPSRQYVTALLAFYEGRHDDALAALDAIDTGAENLAWFYEAALLRGEILWTRGRRGRDHPEQAAADLAASRAALTAAADIGRSDPAVYAALINLEYLGLVDEVYGAGAVDEPLTRGLADTEQALAVLPDDIDALVGRAQLRRVAATYRSNRGEDADDLMGPALADATRAVELAPDSSIALHELARCHRQLGEIREGRGQDPGEQLAKAIEIVNRIAPADRDYDVYVTLGVAHKISADYQDARGIDASDNRRRAVEAYRHALALDDRGAGAWLNLAINHIERARQAATGDAEADRDLTEALAAIERGKAIRPRWFVASFYEGEAHGLRAARLLAAGGDPEPAWSQAVAAYRAGLDINPDMPHLYNGISGVRIRQGEYAAAHGRDPTSLLDEARAAAERAIEVAPTQPFGYSNVGESLVQRVGYERDAGHDPRPLIREALTWYGRALERDPQHVQILLNQAAAYLLLARSQTDRGIDPRSALTHARGSIDRARAVNPSSEEAAALAAACDELAARTPPTPGPR